ncbi:DUF1835 domain-containing protein [Peribacillus sp. SCS-37]|uniref:DUF1835 domain-containing protein n=1 Tax=Paraperibacillus esterisolvens TaxID=3115296 RepID=UPI0039064C91
MINQWKEFIQALPEQEAKSILLQIFLRIQQAKEAAHTKEQLASDLTGIHGEFLSFNTMKKPGSTPAAAYIIFGEAAAGSLKFGFKKLKGEESIKVISFPGILSAGPLWRLDEEAGIQYRYQWLGAHLNYENNHINAEIEEFRQAVSDVTALPQDIPVIICTGHNAHEQTGLRLALNLLKRRSSVYAINPSDKTAEYSRRFGIEFLPLHSGEIEPELLARFLDYTQEDPLPQRERNRLQEEWQELSKGEAVLRIWEKEMIKSVPKEFYDSYILETAQRIEKKYDHEYIKSARLIGDVIGHLEQYHGDVFFEYRLREMIKKGVFEMEGSLKAMRFYGVRISRF